MIVALYVITYNLSDSANIDSLTPTPRKKRNDTCFVVLTVCLSNAHAHVGCFEPGPLPVQSCPLFIVSIKKWQQASL